MIYFDSDLEKYQNEEGKAGIEHFHSSRFHSNLNIVILLFPPLKIDSESNVFCSGEMLLVKSQNRRIWSRERWKVFVNSISHVKSYETSKSSRTEQKALCAFGC